MAYSTKLLTENSHLFGTFSVLKSYKNIVLGEKVIKNTPRQQAYNLILLHELGILKLTFRVETK